MKNNNSRRAPACLLAACLMLPGLAQAGDHVSGDWSWNVDDPEIFVAGIENSAGHMLAQFCDPESTNCFYAVGFGLKCEPGHQYPVLVNADTGSAQLEFICGDRIGDQNVLVASDFDAMDDVVRSANKVGFAIPLEGDDFKAVRFSLNGSNEALDAMREALLVVSNYRPASAKKPDEERF